MPELTPALLEQLQRQRWFGAKGHTLQGAELVDEVTVARGERTLELHYVELKFASTEPETYLLARSPNLPLVLDVLDRPWAASLLLRQVRRGSEQTTRAGGAFVFEASPRLEAVATNGAEPVRPLGVEQSNTSIRFGDSLLLKLFRRRQFGPHPDLEIGRALAAGTEFAHVPPLLGSLEYRDPAGRTAAAAILQAWVPNDGDGWTTTLRRLAAVAEGAAIAPAVEPLARLGTVTADLHLALASARGDDSFAPARISPGDVEEWRHALHRELQQAVVLLDESGAAVDLPSLLARARGLESLVGAEKIRHHGDYHLGQVLDRGGRDWTIVDFEGEPSRPLNARREQRSPLRDVAGMLRSIDYARHAALRAGPASAGAAAWLEHWYQAAREAFLGAYLRRIRGSRPTLLPADGPGVGRALAALELEKAAYELLYEARNRPEWLPIPLAALRGAA